MPGTGRRLHWLPMRDDAAGLATEIRQRSITPIVALGVFRVTLDRDRAKFVVGPYAAGAPA